MILRLISTLLLGAIFAVGATYASPIPEPAGSGRSTRASPLQAGSQSPSYFKTGVLDLKTRIWAQTQIEQVFWSHRIWPKENPQPKPPFEQMVPASVIEIKVTDS